MDESSNFIEEVKFNATINSCPFCGKGDLEPCNCFSGTSNNGKIKPECEGCSG